MMSFMARRNTLEGKLSPSMQSPQQLMVLSLIIDDNYEHALRVFRDRDSGGIRMQASVRSGDLKRYTQ